MRQILATNVCVVGGAGFLGSHLVNYLIEQKGCNVLVLDNLEGGRLQFIHRDAVFQHCDITGSESFIYKILAEYNIQYVFNYAAIPYIPISFERPLHVFNVNAFGAMKVINAAWEVGCKGILQVSSAELYGNDEYEAGKVGYAPGFKLNENCPVQPHSSYGAAKAAIDSMIQVRWREAEVPVISLRQFNCVGERETHPYVIPEIISQLASQPTSKTAYVRLGNNSFRDFQYAGDAVAMAVELLERGQFGEVYNMGSEQGIRIYELAQVIGELMGFSVVTVDPDPTRIRPWEIWHLQSDNSKLYETIDYRPKTTFRKALELTIQDFQENGNRWAWQ